MKYQEFPLTEWLSNREDVKFDLASSSVKSVPFSEIGKIDFEIELNSPDQELEREVEKKIERLYGGEVHAIITSGAQAANSLVLDSLLEDDDEVLVEDPVYSPLKTSPALKGKKVKHFDRKYENGFEVEVDELRNKSSENTKLIVMTNPHNPSGVYQSPDDLSEIENFLEENDIYLLVDEIYRGFIEGSSSLASLSDKVLVSSSFSKVFGFGGFRFGHLVSSDQELIEDIKSVKKYLRPHNSTVKLQMGVKILEDRERLLERSRGIAEKGRSLVKGWVSGSESVDWVEPSPGTISFPRLDINCDAEEFSRKAMEAGVLVTPGKYFSEGGEFSSHVRLTFGKDFQQVAQALQVLSRVMENFKK